MNVWRLVGRFAIALLAFQATACSGPDSDDAVNARQGVSNTLNWTARTEAGVYGYLVYRSEDRAGPYRRVELSVVRVPADGLDRHAYSFVDRQVVPGVTYYYYLDVVSDSGLKQRFSGIISRTTAEAS